MPKKKRKLKLLDPRQEKFLSYYLDINSETYSNAFQSALRAGFSEEYAKTILSPDQNNKGWLSENLGSGIMLQKAERNLSNILDLETREPVVTMIGVLKDKDTGEILTKENPNLLRTKSDVSKFVAERIGKNKYSPRTELTGGNGKPLFDDETWAKSKRAIGGILGNGDSRKAKER